MDQLARFNSAIAELFPRGLKIAMEQLPLAQYNFVLWGVALVTGICLFVGALKYHPREIAPFRTRAGRKKSPAPGGTAAERSSPSDIQETPLDKSELRADSRTAERTAGHSDWVEVKQRRPKKERS